MSNNPQHYIACDLGAESGRVILGSLTDGRLILEEVHRFPTGAIKIMGSMRWDLLRIFDELKIGLRKIADRKLPVRSLSVDSWGVDYVLFNSKHPMLGLPHHYRDPRTDKIFEPALKDGGRELIFSETGIQFMAINMLYQFIAEVEQNRDLLGIADQFLNIGDYLNYAFSGVARNEESNASTTQIYNPRTRSWSKALIERFAFPAKLFPEVVPSGTVLGRLLPEVQEETNLRDAQVIATCSHDTGAAVAAVPATEGDNWAYLSSGTWSLIGVELPQPLINDEALAQNFTNELGFGGTVRFLKNIVGLWILQECRREWVKRGQELSYGQISEAAEDAEPFRSLINPNDARFVKAGGMPEKIQAFCRETSQPAPETPGQYARCIYESLALLYRTMLATLEQLTGRNIKRLHIVGGGSQSRLLNQFAASATKRTVLAGPVEATAIGNLLIQAIALGDIESLTGLRKVVADSFSIQTYEPEEGAAWDAAYERFGKLTPVA